MKINKKIIKQGSFTIILILCLIVVDNVYIYGKENTYINSIGYLEENQNFVIPVTKKEEVETITNASKNLENPKIEIEYVDTLLEYESKKDPIEYEKKNQEELVQGVEVEVNGEKIYVKDQELLTKAKDQIAFIILNDDLKYQKYLQSGSLGDVVINDKTITKISIENEFIYTNTYVPKDKILTTTSEVITALMHKNYYENYEPEIYEVKYQESFEDVLKKNNMSLLDFYINNPKYKNSPLFSKGDEVIVNKVDPVIDIALYYEEQIKEVEEFDTIRKDDDSLDYGEEELEQSGKNGESLVTYRKKIVNGKEEEAKIIKKDVIKDPVNRIILEGTEEGYGSSVSSDRSPSSSINAGGFIWPSDSRTTSRGLSGDHNGTDILGPYGSPEYAAADGVVETAGWSPYGGGYEVTINHGGGLYTVYSHQSQPPVVSAGQSVYQGQVIGYMGQTGLATGTHLHFEVREGCSSGAFSGYPVEPYAYMS